MKQETERAAMEYEEWKKAYHAQLGKRVQKALAERAAIGKPIGCAPIGYKNTVIDGERVIVQNDQVASLVREAFELNGSGKYSLRQLLAIMTEKGLRSRNGKMMGVSAFRGMLLNPFYCGYQRVMDKFVKPN